MSCEADDYAAQIREMLEVQRAAQQLLDQVAKNPPPEPGIPAPNAIGGRGGQSLQSHGDSEFFLDAFSAGRVSNESQGSSNIELDANAGKGKQQCSRDSEIVKIGSRQTGTTSWSSGEGKLKGSSGERESQSVKLSISKKRPLSLTPTGVQKKQVPQRRSRSEFMNSARSASKQVAVKLAIQADANRFLATMGDKGDMEYVRAVVGVTSTRCLHPDCTKQDEAMGECMTRGGVRECAFFDCNNQKKGAYEELTNGFLAVVREEGKQGEKDASKVVQRLSGSGSRCHVRRICSEESCERVARSQGKCRAHGGDTRQICSFANCTTRAVKRGLCAAHGGNSACTIEGCGKKVQSWGLCGAHGGRRKCKVENCDTTAYVRGYCQRHDPKKDPVQNKCVVEGCLKHKARLSYCREHARERGLSVGRKCKRPGCTKEGRSKGLCRAHGDRVACKEDGCKKRGLPGAGYCFEHGGGRCCKFPECNRIAQVKGLCYTHDSRSTCKAKGCNKKLAWEGFCSSHQSTKEPTEKKS